ncbi:E3 SUMO-protein ligase KIAA1586-like [Tachypleus tridentatus]|uniref:E3 SUMO-protein ligase KIAA1586-like n=1 Tax=Tachypleus tridentatus TaxID=6853 RepID=UPI003FCF8DE7
MIDESTDISAKQNLVNYIRVLEMNQFDTVTPQTYFLGICELYKANAENIFTKVISMLSENGIEVKNLCSVSSDGAAVMVGSKSGVVTRLKQFVPSVLATGADSIPYLVKYQDIMNSISKFFKYSPKNMATLTAVQSIINAEEKRFKEIFHTRWLSFEGAADALLSNYSSLVSVFMEETSGKALSLYKPITSFKFLYVSHYLADCLKPLAILAKTFQRKILISLKFTHCLLQLLSVWRK